MGIRSAILRVDAWLGYRVGAYDEQERDFRYEQADRWDYEEFKADNAEMLKKFETEVISAHQLAPEPDRDLSADQLVVISRDPLDIS